MNTHQHVCPSCGDTKIIVLKENERPEDLKGCVCDRTIERHRIKDRDLFSKLKDSNFDN